MHAAAQRTPSSRLFAQNGVRFVLLSAVAVAAASLAVAPAAAAGSGGAPQGKGNVQPLWKSYPLDPGAGRVGHTAVQKPAVRAEHSAAGGSGGGSSVTVRLVGGIAALLFLVVGTLLVLRSGQSRRAPTKGERMNWFTNKRPGRDASEDGFEVEEDAASKGRDSIPEVVAVREVKPTLVEDAPPEPAPPTRRPEPPPTPRRDATQELPTRPSANERARVGEHVESVLKAAEDAAAHLIEEARAQAREIREAAERESASGREAAAGARAAAENDAATIRAAAKEEAEAIRVAAQRHAATFEEEAEARYDELLNDTALAEDRLRRLVDGLRDVADRLDDLLEPAEDEEPDDEPTVQPGASLEQALDPNATQAGAAAT